MSAQQQRVTRNTIIKSFPAPTQPSLVEPHIKDVFGKPRNVRGIWSLQFNCHETDDHRYWASINDKFIFDEDIHDFLMKHYAVLGAAFGRHWISLTQVRIPQMDDVVYDYEDRELFVIASVSNQAQSPFIHPYHRDRIITIKANKIEINDTFNDEDIIVTSKEYILSYEFMKVIGEVSGDRIKDGIATQELFAIGDRRMYRILSKKLISIPKPTKRARKVKVSDDFEGNHWKNYLNKHLENQNVNVNDPFRGVITLKFRKTKFQAVFPLIPIQTEDQYTVAYLDYFTIKVSLRSNRITIDCVSLKQDKMSGFIQGEDLIPNPF